MTTLVLAEDHKLLRDCMRMLFERLPTFKVVAEVENGLEAVRACKVLHPDIALLDMSMPVMDGVQATAEILRHSPKTKVAIISAYCDEVTVTGAILAGARAYVSKSASVVDLLAALDVVLRGGGPYLSPQAAESLASGMRAGRTKVDPRFDKLSARELQVLQLISAGLGSKEIASTLDLGIQTVRGYRKSLMRKMGVTNATALVSLYLRDTAAFRQKRGE